MVTLTPDKAQVVDIALDGRRRVKAVRIVMASDHAGYKLKKHLIEVVKSWGHEVCDVGCDSEESCDYPYFAEKAVFRILEKKADLGILVCGTGQGMAICANKFPGIRAAVCQEPYSARAAREHNDANILALGARIVGPGVAEMIVEHFLTARFAGGRHQQRIDLIGKIEDVYMKRR